jgi:dihydroneopterin aldolase
VDKILLSGLDFFGKHGCYGPEREAGQRFVVDIEITADLQKASHSDELDDTINYVEIFNFAKATIEGESAFLLEHLAGKIGDFALTYPQTKSVMVRIRKPHVAVNGSFDYLGVEIVRTR